MKKHLKGNRLITDYLPKQSLVTISLIGLSVLFGAASSMASGTNNDALLAKKATSTASISTQQQQKKIVGGTVVDSNGEPLVGVSVQEKNTSNGTMTDINGHFSLSLTKSDAQVVVSYIGFSTQTLTATDDMNIVLKEDNQQLDEVVVVGYGTQKKANLTGSVASVNFQKEASSRPITTATQALAGMAAGVQVLQSSGRPNAEGFGIQIRGTGTFNNSNPLVLVDGMEMNLADVNPNDIENISILKDAASCAIYGNRGANGVILITTKMGQAGTVRVTYSGKLSINAPSKIVRFVSNYADYMGFVNEADDNVGAGHTYSDATIKPRPTLMAFQRADIPTMWPIRIPTGSMKYIVQK